MERLLLLLERLRVAVLAEAVDPDLAEMRLRQRLTKLGTVTIRTKGTDAWDLVSKGLRGFVALEEAGKDKYLVSSVGHQTLEAAEGASPDGLGGAVTKVIVLEPLRGEMGERHEAERHVLVSLGNRLVWAEDRQAFTDSVARRIGARLKH